MKHRSRSVRVVCLVSMVALLACEGPIYYGVDECDLDRVEDVLLSEIDEALVEMDLPPAAYLDTIDGAHRVLAFRAQAGGPTPVPEDASEVELVFTPFRDEAFLDIHGPRSYDGDRCYFERLHAVNEVSLRTLDGTIVLGPIATGVTISAIDEDFTGFDTDVSIDPDFLAEFGIEDVPATVYLSGVVVWEDPEAPARPVAINAAISDHSSPGNPRPLLKLRTAP